MQRLTYHEYMKCFNKGKGLSLTYTALLILSVEFIVQLWLCIKLTDHYNDTDSESITCHRFCIALICWKHKVPTGNYFKGYATAVTKDRLAIVIELFLAAKTYNSAVLAVAQSFILTTHVRIELIMLSSHSSSSTNQGSLVLGGLGLGV